MKIGFLVNDATTELPEAATTTIAHAAARRGHTVVMIGVGELIYGSDRGVQALGRRAPPGGAGSRKAFLDAIRETEPGRIAISDHGLDVLYLRYNPGESGASKPWEHSAGMTFGQMAARSGVMVLSHPSSLWYTVSKMYLEHFPEAIRPQTVITRSYEEILRFHQEQGEGIVLKPLAGYGGKDVYLFRKEIGNLQQVVQSLSRSSYIIAQEYLPAASEGDTRLFLFNGKPLVVDGKYAAVRRVNEAGDFRSNMSAGGKPRKAEITAKMLEIAEIVRPRLLADGIFDVGLDIAGDRLLEINSISSGGLSAAGKLEGVDFGAEVVRLIERKVEHRRRYGPQLPNRALAVME